MTKTESLLCLSCAHMLMCAGVSLCFTQLLVMVMCQDLLWEPNQEISKGHLQLQPHRATPTVSTNHLHLMSISYFYSLFVPFNFMFTLNLAIIHFPNIDSLQNALECEILIVCWEPSLGPRGKRWRCRSGSVRISLPGAPIDQERTVNSKAFGHTRQPFALPLSTQPQFLKDKVFLFRFILWQCLDKVWLLKTTAH